MNKIAVLLVGFLLVSFTHSTATAETFDGDVSKIEVLKKKGIDLSLPRKAKFLLYFQRQEDALRTLKMTEEIGFKKYELNLYSKDHTLLWVSKTVELNVETIREVTRQLHKIALQNNGSYEYLEWELLPE